MLYVIGNISIVSVVMNWIALYLCKSKKLNLDLEIDVCDNVK